MNKQSRLNRYYFASLLAVIVMSLLCFGLRSLGGYFIVISDSLECASRIESSPNLEIYRIDDKSIRYDIVGRVKPFWRWDKDMMVEEVYQAARGGKVVIQF